MISNSVLFIYGCLVRRPVVRYLNRPEMASNRLCNTSIITSLSSLHLYYTLFDSADSAAGAVKAKVCGVGGGRAADDMAVAKSDDHAVRLRWAWGGGCGLGGGCQTTVEAAIDEVGVGGSRP